MINEAEPVSRVQIQAPRWVFFYTTDINGIQGSLAFSSEKNSFEVICTQIMPEKADTRRPQCGFHMWDLVNIGFVLEALLVGLVGKPMVLELGRHTAFTPFPWWWPGAKSLAEILSDRREHNTKPRWCSSMCREMHCLRLPPHNIDTCTYQCRWIWYQFCSTICIQCDNCDDKESIVSVKRCSRSDFGQSVTWLTPSLTQQAGTSCTKLTGGL